MTTFRLYVIMNGVRSKILTTNITLYCHYDVAKKFGIGDDNMKNLVTEKTKRIKCYRCYNYINVKRIDDNSFSGYCNHCGSHIHIVNRSKQTLIRIVNN